MAVPAQEYGREQIYRGILFAGLMGLYLLLRYVYERFKNWRFAKSS